MRDICGIKKISQPGFSICGTPDVERDGGWLAPRNYSSSLSSCCSTNRLRLEPTTIGHQSNPLSKMIFVLLLLLFSPTLQPVPFSSSFTLLPLSLYQSRPSRFQSNKNQQKQQTLIQEIHQTHLVRFQNMACPLLKIGLS